MKMNEVTIIDYGIGNLLNVQRGFEHFGASVTLTSDPAIISSASKLVLPGVGAFADGIAELNRRGLSAVIQEAVAQNVPLLGICLGMQMLLDESEEFGINKGLGLIPGQVVPIPVNTTDGISKKIPHIGWNELIIGKEHNDWQGSLLQDVIPGESVYFVHSYMAIPQDPKDRIGECLYGGTPISALINRGNVYGCQFHPEKSGKTGLKILRNFLNL